MRLFFLFYTLVATALAGVGITVVLAAGLPGWQPIVAATGVGVLIAMPAAWLVARKIATL